MLIAIPLLLLGPLDPSTLVLKSLRGPHWLDANTRTLGEIEARMIRLARFDSKALRKGIIAYFNDPYDIKKLRKRARPQGWQFDPAEEIRREGEACEMDVAVLSRIKFHRWIYTTRNNWYGPQPVFHMDQIWTLVDGRYRLRLPGFGFFQMAGYDAIGEFDDMRRASLGLKIKVRH